MLLSAGELKLIFIREPCARRSSTIATVMSSVISVQLTGMQSRHLLVLELSGLRMILRFVGFYNWDMVFSLPETTLIL